MNASVIGNTAKACALQVAAIGFPTIMIVQTYGGCRARSKHFFGCV